MDNEQRLSKVDQEITDLKKFIIALQRQISALAKDNKSLRIKISELEGNVHRLSRRSGE